MSSGSVDKIKELLGNGLSNEIVATAVGVSISYISQLMADEQFSAEVISLRTIALTDATVRDRSWDGLENKMLDNLHNLVDQKMIYKVNDVVKVLAIANNAKRRGATSQDALTTHKTVVQLTLPAVIVNKYRKTLEGEVVEVITDEGASQTLITMPAAALMQKLAAENVGDKKYETLKKYLPAPATTDGSGPES